MHNTQPRVLIVDDSPFMGQVLKKILLEENMIVEVAYNGREALEKVKAFKPSVITMDIEMPVMSGLEALQVIMETEPLPVVMVSVQTVRGAEISIRALELGAFDFVAKPTGETGYSADSFKRELVSKIRIACLVPREKLTRPLLKATIPVLPPGGKAVTPYSVLAIGTSTGGPTALQSILSQLPKTFPIPIVVVQHMPKNFTKMMAERLNTLCELQVKEAEEGDCLVPGLVLIAPGGQHMTLRMDGQEVVSHIMQEAPTATPYKPSVNVLFNSVAEMYGNSAIAMLLTGMGSDGLDGARRLKERGAYLLAEAEETCIVYGMAKCMVDAGLADRVLPLPDIAKFLVHKAYV